MTCDDRGGDQVESFIALYLGICRGRVAIFHNRSTDERARGKGRRAGRRRSSGRIERSLREYVDQVRWRLSGDFSALSRPEPNQYFADDLVHVGSNEVFVDCGAFTGDTLLDVAKRVDAWDAYHAFEPDPESFAVLQVAVASLPPSLAERVHLHRAATADQHGTAMFNATGLGSARLSTVGEYEVECVTIDETITESRPTFIKMDIEGAEAGGPGRRDHLDPRGTAPARHLGLPQAGGSLGATVPGARHEARLPPVPPTTCRGGLRYRPVWDPFRQARGRGRRRGLTKENSCAALRAIGVRLGQLSRRSPSGSPGWARPHLQWFRRLPRWGVLAQPGRRARAGVGVIPLILADRS